MPSAVPPRRPRAFVRAVEDVLAQAQQLRPSVHVEEVPAPVRLAPWALAVAGDVVSDGDDLADGRFVLLHDPAGQQGWAGSWRVVVLARAAVEEELAADPLLLQVGWAWWQDALAAHGLDPAVLGGTVTRVASRGFGDLAGSTDAVEVEVRSSFSPHEDGAGAALRAWADLLCSAAGLPPLPAGVLPFPTRP